MVSIHMDDNKTQDSKKTVVAFVAGLLIGGLLVWIFSASPEAAAPGRVFDGDDRDAAFEGERNNDSDKTEEENAGAATIVQELAGDFTFTIANQPAGSVVSLGSAQYPTAEGWIVVHEDVDGELGSALGAARYDTVVGLTPTSIDLLRNTMTGKTYRVVYYTESGDKMFDRKEDVPMTKNDGGLIEATFVAK